MSGWKVHFWEGCQKSVRVRFCACFSPYAGGRVLGPEGDGVADAMSEAQREYALVCIYLSRDTPRKGSIF